MKRVGLAMLVCTQAAWAHEGHGATEGSSLLHWLAEPLHAVPVLAALAVAGVLAWRGRRTRA